MVDFDGDGDLDAIVGDLIGNSQFFRNVGTATAPSFSKVNGSFGIPEVGDYAHPTFVDIDGDGDLDAFIGEDGFDTPIHFFRNVRTNLVTIVQSGGSTNVAEGGASDTYTVVLKNQPTADVTITFQTNGQISTNTTNLVFTPANWNVAQTVKVTAINDNVGEGKHTAVISHTVSSTDPAYNGAFSLPVVANITDNDLPKANPKFIAPLTNPFGLSENPSFLQTAFVDIDGDGDLDAFQNGSSFGPVRFLRNVGTANAPNFVRETDNFGITEIDSSITNPSFADIDGDGDMDVFVGDRDGITHFFRNTGTAKKPSFTSEANNFGITDVGTYANLTFADIDNDGDIDAFVGNNAGKTQFFENIGTASAPVFDSSTSTFGIPFMGGIVRHNLVDIDGDGDLDMFVGDAAGDTHFFRNTGSASAPNFVSASGSFGIGNVGSFASPAFADIDGDGDMDAFVGNNDGEIRFFENAARSRPVLAAPADIVYTDTKFDDTFATKTGSLTATDANGDSLTYGIQGGKELGNGTVSLVNSFGTLTVTKATGAYSVVAKDAVIEALAAKAAANFTVTVSDGLLISSQTLTLRINQSGTTETNGDDTLLGTTANNSFNALSGNDTINGNGGADTMRGGTGNDTYIVDNIGDKVIETSTLATEIDLVQSSVNHTLAANLENLTLTGVGNLTGSGNSLNNTLVGNNGNNLLIGLVGNDILTGGLGLDKFRLATLDRDRITDFNVADDVIQLDNAVFTQLTATGVLSANNFKIGAAKDADDHILYNSTTGVLTYDDNGNGAGGATQIAVLGAGLALTNADFNVI
ncbi:FG-GAP-like repeat-containing protein [Methylocucumis oryzae]|uniref:FG-GAP-like repeat-containing protein n=1 Tax=Methylocucumis oryzae TaxID=1632867 RepID=UPI000697272A|nr:FG-GAP-like repeat-containing protein [Methylocucumis oryzae]